MDERRRDTKSGVLKRDMVRDHLLDLVDERRPGDAIPSERSLCARLGVSRPTLRAAVNELVANGLIVREHGRGMFVAPAKITQELVSEERRPFALPQAEGVWSSSVLEFSTVPAGARVGRRLRISPAAEIVHVSRLRLVDGEPMAIEYLHVPVERVPGLTVEDVDSDCFYDHLHDRHGIEVAEAVQTIEPTVTNDAEARLLEVPEFSPALLFERLTSDSQGRPVEYVHSLYRGDRYRIMSRLTLTPAARGRRRSPADGHYPGIPPGDLDSAITSSTSGDVQP
ncbi:MULTISPECIES: GntR family transcriptional regulator [unclassified Nocardiopsis]|uniref:GntR family transcriptional regulator n=1 Tax=Nocardiopsis TaxID=2013 RepID=UPI00387AFA56